MMKKMLLRSIMILVLLASLVACMLDDGDSNDEAKVTEDEDWYEDLIFGTFILNAKYGDGKYVAEYKYYEGEATAKVEDNRGDKEKSLEGEEALIELRDKLPELELTNVSSDEQIIAEVVNVFELEEDYDELKVEMEFFEKKVDVEDE